MRGSVLRKRQADRAENPQQRILHDIKAERLIAPGGAASLRVQPVEVAIVKRLNRIFMTGRQRRGQLFRGVGQRPWASLVVLALGLAFGC